MAPPRLHGRVRIGLPELHGRICMVWPKLHGRFRMVWPKLHGRFCMVWPKFGNLYWDSICSHQICTVGVFWHTLSIMQDKHWKNLFEIECIFSIMMPLSCHFSTIPKPYELGTWNFWENYHHTLYVMCPVSHVRCHMSLVTCHVSYFFYIVVKLACWRSFINKVYPV